ncbi:Heat shock protein HslJ [Tenacibaculum mesophilum]|uniref:META domain-containing protein n=1 Tax=Tenacibaculum mesophilum TaxID=104268 RepID=A0ABN5TBC6_9FLAO|nr:META domain-containing protein [Tenacibaculum mesophilum]AZJ33670.1 META domain-containing protein [Tenacibaculum mesophilum]KAF9659891.1 META domain-containing protein [Tenacibaculum mesophilum]QFS28911.1 META domain-containing protein [Tenacibaculum mesophilum]SHF56116.1 Heat shock protein HslJ [Tenacibaculum mesophilum]
MKNLIPILLSACLVISACSNKKEKKTSEEKTVTTTDSVSKTPTATKNTITDAYFKGHGVEPFWSVTISDKMITFKTPTDSISTPHIEPIYAQDSNVKLYTLHTELAALKIEIIQMECINAMSGKSFPYSVTLKYKKGKETEFTTLEGCGQYITNYRLHDIWALEELNGVKVNKDDFGKELPYIEINAAENSFMGTSGCNRIMGKLFSERNKTRFTNIASTEMLCAKGNEKEQEFTKALESTISYTIANNRLTLLNPDKTLLVFKKVD